MVQGLCPVNSVLFAFVLANLTGCRNVSLSCEHLFSVFMRTLTGCTNVSLSCEHFTLCSCKHCQVAEMCLCHVSILISLPM